MTLEQILLMLGVNIISGVSSTGLYDWIKSFFKKKPNLEVTEFKVELQKRLDIENAEVASEKIIEFLAENGDIEILGSKIYAKESILLQSSERTEIQMKNGSSTHTDHTKIVVKGKGSVRASGGATIEQSDKGIKFST